MGKVTQKIMSRLSKNLIFVSMKGESIIVLKLCLPFGKRVVTHAAAGVQVVLIYYLLKR